MLKSKPEILTQPQIPKPLHGINPRSIKGDSWWNSIRQVVYASTDFHCIACGVHKSYAKGHKWLEAHESYNIDYDSATWELDKIYPLCNYCHNFIHSGRLLSLGSSGKISYDKCKSILEHGFKILAEYRLKCFPGTLEVAHYFGARTFDVEPEDTPDLDKFEWSDFIMIIDGQEYFSKFKSYGEWEEYYGF